MAAVILDYSGLYCEDSWSPGWGHIYVGDTSLLPFVIPTSTADNCRHFCIRIRRDVLSPTVVLSHLAALETPEAVAKAVRCESCW